MIVPQNRLFRLFALALTLAALTLPGLAQASRYRVDVIVFIDHGGVGDEQSVPARALNSSRVIDPGDASRLAASGINVLSPSSFGLQSEWQHLRNARRFKPVIKLSWVQNAASSGTPLRLSEGGAVTLADGSQISTVSGHIALYTGTFLHLDTDLAYTTGGANGAAPASYRLDEVRRVKFNEIHYLDSPRLGVLARVSKLQ